VVLNCHIWQMCVYVSSAVGHHHHLCSAARYDLITLWTRLLRYGPHSFADSGPMIVSYRKGAELHQPRGPMIWNGISLTAHNLSQTFVTFCNRLKTKLFGTAYGELSLVPS